MWGWEEYVPVATRLAKAKRKMDQLRKKGKTIETIEVQGRTIAKKFWGKRWCEYLENFADFENRLPRGRTYARNGSICHLGIKKGLVEAFVSGSSLYTVKVKIKTFEQQKWKIVKNKCSGQIGSVLELLKGELSDHVMEVVADPKEGLFPNEKEIDFSCSCLDWAEMCKHVAAVLYGIAARLDERPDLLFLLRGVDAQELITTKLTTSSIKTDDLLQDKGLSELFDIDIDDGTSPPVPSPEKQDKRSIDPTTMTGKDLQTIRLEMNLTVREFAEGLGATTASIYRWEKKGGALNLHKRISKAIIAIIENKRS